ncbi:biotin-dependent carboxyltransferase family protein [Burkholderiaceae bacterium DAT-1]|nr:biotin-dependent carboxyltransferase family protein [Burkholderiaceae bacterium DAT-1]
MITLLKSPVQALIQDHGRFGYRHVGVTSAGAMDALSMRLANMLVGNGEYEAILEFTMPPCAIRFESPATIALTGAECGATLDEHPVQRGYTLSVRAGQILRLGPAGTGCRAILAVAGGFDVPVYMGSKSTDVQAGLGQMLKSGAQLRLSGATYMASPGKIRLPEARTVLRVLEGPEWNQLGTTGQRALLGTDWKISPHANRMGYRLEGAQITMVDRPEMRSHGVMQGVIQLPPDGLPIVLGADAQATGGYPRIASVIEADWWCMGQLRPGQRIHFECCSRDSAFAALRMQQHWLNKLAKALARPT